MGDTFANTSLQTSNTINGKRNSVTRTCTATHNTATTTTTGTIQVQVDHDALPFLLPNQKEDPHAHEDEEEDDDVASVTVTDFSTDHSHRSTCASSFASEGRHNIHIERLNTSFRSCPSNPSSQKSPAHILRSPSNWKKIKPPKSTTSTASASHTTQETTSTMSHSWHGKFFMNDSSSVISTSTESFCTPHRSRCTATSRRSSTAQIEALRLAAMMQNEEYIHPHPHTHTHVPNEQSTQTLQQDQSKPTFTKNVDFLAETIAQSTFMKNMEFLFGPKK